MRPKMVPGILLPALVRGEVEPSTMRYETENYGEALRGGQGHGYGRRSTRGLRKEGSKKGKPSWSSLNRARIILITRAEERELLYLPIQKTAREAD